jgi:hypothetical protein
MLTGSNGMPINQSNTIVLFIVILGLAAYCSLIPDESEMRTKHHGTAWKTQYEFKTDMSSRAVGQSAVKRDHIMCFAILFALGSAIAGRGRQLLIWVGLLALGLAIEIAQGFINTRSGQVSDLIPDLMGMIIGSLIAAALRDRAR